MNNDSQEYKHTASPSGDVEEPTSQLKPEIEMVYTDLEPIFPDEIARFRAKGTCEWEDKGVKFRFSELADMRYEYNVLIDVFHQGTLIFPDVYMSFNELTTASTTRNKFQKDLHAAIPSFTEKEIKTIVAQFTNVLRVDEHYRESAHRWDILAKNRFKDRNNPEAYRQIDDAILAGGNPFVSNKGEISKVEMADYLIQKFHLKVMNIKDGKKNKFIYNYDANKGVYDTHGLDICHSEIDEILGDQSSTALKYEITNRIITTKKLWMKPDDFRPECPYTINVENGLLDTRTFELKHHSPEHTSTVQYPIKYDPDAECPWFNKFITDVLPNPIDRRDVLEFFGYSLLPYLYNCYHKSLMLLGKPGTGKGTLLDTLQQLIGEQYVSTSDLQKIETNQFQAFQLVHKVANISDDLPKESMSDCPNFKSITTGGRINVQDKGKTAFDTRIYAKLISAANNLPYAPTEGNDAYFARFIIVRMNRVFRGTKEQIPNLIKKLTTPEEKSGMLNVLLKHLQVILENDKLSYDKSLEDVKRLYELEQNHVGAFFLECTTESVQESLKCDVFEAYVRWCEAQGIEEPYDIDGLTRKVNQSKVILSHIKGGQSKKAPYRDKMVWYDLELKIPWQIRTNSPPQVKKPHLQLPPIRKTEPVLKLDTDEEGNLQHSYEEDGHPHEHD